MSDVAIGGSVQSGFEAVADAFQENFRSRGEVGAAVAVYRGSERLVDLWGGVANTSTGAAWERDTVILVFSTTKGMAGLAMAHAHARGLYDYDAPVARYWPEFGQARKERITVRQLLAHEAGLAVIDEPLTLKILEDHDRRDEVIARQKPAWRPGDHWGYHATSLGFYEAALLRRCDPKGRGVGAYFADEIARPLGLDFWIGLPPDFPIERVARIIDYHPLELIRHVRTLPQLRFLAAYLNPLSLTRKALSNPKLERPGDLDTPAYWRLEFPTSTGVGEVRAIARAYGEFASGGATLSIDPATLFALEQPAEFPRKGVFDLVLRTDSRYSMGFLRPFPQSQFASSRGYGAPGAGGSMGFADPEAGIGFAYAPNKMGFELRGDSRGKALREAVYNCLSA